ncbi:hypothetical protein QQF45_09335 [Halopseudomonas aestusnigri]|uniref:hypothetical protein n=1 Tax=Halopseudomonas aestusnigri TaxID=857252 RepID=UPI0025557831|nr:hypothetical protein [Halopseudomonas aestusnigri]MDL2199268.1 hypothetical protein [Halopseudomonas aestusnigri]
MLQDLIQIKTDELSASEKLVLLVFSTHFDASLSGPMSLPRLAEKLGLREGLVAAAMPALLGKGVMTARVCYGATGRPVREFALDEAKLRTFPAGRKLREASVLSAASFLRTPTIKSSMLNWSGQPGLVDAEDGSSEGSESAALDYPKVRRMVECRKGLLDASDVLLLTVLLAVSDSLGVVEGWSSRQLALLIGVTPLALKGRLKKLVRHGVIRQVIPGVAAPIFQKKLKTIILLNTNHRLFASVGRKVAVCIDRGAPENGEVRLLQSLFFESKGVGSANFSAKEVALLKSLPLHAFKQLEYVLLELASNGLVSVLGEQKIDRSRLIEAAKTALQGVIRVPKAGDSVVSQLRSYAAQGLIESLAFQVYLLAVELNDRIGKELAKAGTPDRLLVLPGNMFTGYEYVAVLAYPCVGGGDPVDEVNGPWRGVFAKETDISQSTRERVGLVSSV